MKKLGAVLILVPILAGLASAQAPASRWPFEIGAYGALSFGANTFTLYWARIWSHVYLDEVDDSNTIEAAYKLGLSGGAFATFYVSQKVGFQVSAATQTTRTPTNTYFTFTWLWNNDVDNMKSRAWEGTGSIRVMPFSLNLVYRLGQDSVRGILSAGVSLFKNTYQANANLGFGVDQIVITYIGENAHVDQYLDALPLELKISDASWTAIGGNVGAGLDVELSRTTALRFDVRYFYCPVKTLTWEIAQKSYNGMFFNDIKNYVIDQTMSDYIHALQPVVLKVNPSFLQASAAFVLRFGAVIPD
jgi:hypothetical protein